MVKLTLEFNNLKELQVFVGLLLYIHRQANRQMYNNNETYERLEMYLFSDEKGTLEKAMNNLIEQVK